jgi:hypothetical protein
MRSKLTNVLILSPKLYNYLKVKNFADTIGDRTKIEIDYHCVDHIFYYVNNNSKVYAFKADFENEKVNKIDGRGN